MAGYKHKLFVAFPAEETDSRRQKIDRIRRSIPNCPEQVKGFKEYFPEQLKDIGGDSYLYDFDEPGKSYYHPAVIKILNDEAGNSEIFDKWFLRYQESIDIKRYECDEALLRDYDYHIKMLTQVQLELTKPIETSQPELLNLLRNFIYYHRYILLIIRDQIIEPITQCQGQFSFGELVR
jgi:hypothetical protein